MRSFKPYVLALKENPYLDKSFYNVCDLDWWRHDPTGHGFSWVVWINSAQDEKDILSLPTFLGMSRRTLTWWIGKAHRLGLGPQVCQNRIESAAPGQEKARARARNNWK